MEYSSTKIIFLNQEHDHQFQVKVEKIPSIRSNQEETDTRVILYIQYAESLGFPSAVVCTPDSNIFFILLFHAYRFNIIIYLDIGIGKNRRLINISELSDEMGKDWCAVLLSFYVFTGEEWVQRERQGGSHEEIYKDFPLSCLVQVFFCFCFVQNVKCRIL